MDIKMKAGKKYSICSCGQSQTLPFCDNAHRKYNSANGTVYKSVKIIPDQDVIIHVNSSMWKLDKNTEK